uniref:Uncharacterized protein n=1 Tax=Glossina palpalis gambiensis TaxID=67801 RepID=A0A1B0B830_9MUSC
MELFGLENPLRLAPNLITIVSLMVNVVSTFILARYSSGEITPTHRWTRLFSAFDLFLYQSLDSIAGKLARRINMSSQLENCDLVQPYYLNICTYFPETNSTGGKLSIFLNTAILFPKTERQSWFHRKLLYYMTAQNNQKKTTPYLTKLRNHFPTDCNGISSFTSTI